MPLIKYIVFDFVVVVTIVGATSLAADVAGIDNANVVVGAAINGNARVCFHPLNFSSFWY